MLTDGAKLRWHIDNQMISKVQIARDLGITRTTLYQYFNSAELEKETKDKLVAYFKQDIFGLDYSRAMNVLQEPDAGTTYTERRRKENNKHAPHAVPFIPVKAQAGYVKAIDQEVFLDTLEKYALPPGVTAHGAIWRYWEVEGDSMEPTFREGDIVLTSFVHPMDWENIRNFYTYVIVTQDRILIKRLYCKNAIEWVLISDNEDLYAQQLLPIEDVKEVWVYRKTWSTRASPPKEFKILV